MYVCKREYSKNKFQTAPEHLFLLKTDNQNCCRRQRMGMVNIVCNIIFFIKYLDLNLYFLFFAPNINELQFINLLKPLPIETSLLQILK